MLGIQKLYNFALNKHTNLVDIILLLPSLIKQSPVDHAADCSIYTGFKLLMK